MRTLRILSVLLLSFLPPTIAGAQVDSLSKKLAVVTSFRDATEGRPYTDALERSLQNLGWTPHANLTVSYIWAGSEPAKIATAVGNLSSEKTDIILAAGTGVLTAVKKAVAHTRVVFIQISDPVGGGFVESLERPNGNMTGVRNPDLSIFGERVAITRQLAPSIKRILVLSEPGYPTVQGASREIQKTAAMLGVSVTSAFVGDEAEAQDAIQAFARGENGALAIITSPKMTALRQLTLSASKYRLPAVYPLRSYVEAGGLASYGITQIGMYEQAAEIIDLVLKGKQPGGIPVQSPTKMEFLIKRNVAVDLGLGIPDSLVSRGAIVID
jgi:putative ABC transport system substrate-binding protein